jgi:non-specific serine/threonine protein kinase
MPGGEYLSPESLATLWTKLSRWASTAVKADGGLSAFLGKRAEKWQRVGRVTFHLAENRADSEKPFAFMATYVDSLTAEGRDRHMPLGQALSRYAGEGDRLTLLKLLTPVREAAERLAWVAAMADSGAVFRPQAMDADRAHRFLMDVPELERSGLMVRIPDWWRRRPRARVSITIGQNHSPVLGMGSLLDWDVRLAVGDMAIEREDLERLLASGERLVLFKGQWMEADREKLQEALDWWSQARAASGNGQISFLSAMRLLAGYPGADIGSNAPESANLKTSGWVGVEAGAALRPILESLRSPGKAKPPRSLEATLRPYQEEGLSFLSLITGLGLGALLADDMGLGKTIQVLALLLADQERLAGLNGKNGSDGKNGKNGSGGHNGQGGSREAISREAQPKNGKNGQEAQEAQGSLAERLALPSLLVAPASLLGNWLSEARRFAPSLKLRVYHPSEASKEDLALWDKDPDSLTRDCHLVVTSYSMLNRRLDLFSEIQWRFCVLDEAQAIKNPGSGQAKATKKIKAFARLALTGTPIENRLTDLWSIFDYLNPGLLGSAAKFREAVSELDKRHGQDQYGPIRRLVSPYLLRRLKTDKRVIDDLPDKTETDVQCFLTEDQAKLYALVVGELKNSLGEFEGPDDSFRRRGMVLQTLMRLKQLCNHPAHLTGDKDWRPERSGKFLRLSELVSELKERQERMLVFTQFQEVIEPLSLYMEKLFGRPGLVLHGGTPVGKRRGLVELFQSDDGPPFFILSLKAGGTGLNLTAAGHVFHFDRWWNPAAEDQATDRAYRIGQKKNVLVHKCVTRGTVEEKVDAMLKDKRRLAGEILSKGGEMDLAGLDDEALLNVISLDLDRALMRKG